MILTTHLEQAEPKEVKFGVPQGSILGPLLFIIYLADMPPHQQAMTALFADDTALLTQNKNVNMAIATMTRALNALLLYFETWRLIVNPTKTQAIIFTGNANTPPAARPITLKGVLLPWGTSLKYLGIIMDRGLRLNAHALYLKQRVTQTFFKLTGIIGSRSYLEPAVKLLFYKVLLRPILQYAAPVWAPLMSNTSWQELQIAQNKPLRAAISATRYDSTQQIHRDTEMAYIHDHLIKLSWQFYASVRTRHPHLTPDADLRRRKAMGRFEVLRPPEVVDDNPDDPDAIPGDPDNPDDPVA